MNAGTKDVQISLGNPIVFEDDTRASYNKLAEDMTAYFKLSDKDKARRPERIRKEAQALIECDPASRKREIERLIIQRLLLRVDAVQSSKSSLKRKNKAHRSFPPVAASVSKVIDTTELLEAILSHLTILDLVAATGVNKEFQLPDAHFHLAYTSTKSLPTSQSWRTRENAYQAVQSRWKDLAERRVHQDDFVPIVATQILAAGGF